MIEFVNDTFLDNVFYLGKITDPAELVEVAFDFHDQMVTMSV